MRERADRLSGLSEGKRALLLARLAARRVSASPLRSEALGQTAARETRHDPFPLTELQQAYWVGRGAGFAMGQVAAHSYFEIEGEHLDVDRLERAWQRLIDRHDMLRAVVEVDGRQRVLPTCPAYRLPTLDLRTAAPGAVTEELATLRAALSHQVAPPDRWPLFDLRAVLLPGNRVRILVSLDALIADGWSMELLFREWARLHREPDAALPPLELTFRDYVAMLTEQQTSTAFARAEAYWTQRVDTLPPAPQLPLWRQPDALGKPEFVRRHRRLNREVWQRLKRQASALGLTSNVLLLAAYADVIAVWGGGGHFTLNVPGFNRLPVHAQVTEIVGEFASFTLLEVDYRAPGIFEDRARQLQRQLWEDLEHAEFGGVRVLRALAQRAETEAPPIMPVVFTSAPQDSQDPTLTLPGAIAELGELVFAINQTSQVWLDNHVTEHAGELLCDWDTVDAVFPPGVPDTLLDAYFRHLQCLAESPDAWSEPWTQTASALLPAAEVHVMRQANTQTARIPECLVQDFFLDRARRHPERVAVIGDGRSVSYGELYAMAAATARTLQERGLGPGLPVAIMMEKGWEQVVAAIGVLLAGSPYVPLDASAPPQRLQLLLERSAARWMLTQSWLSNRCAALKDVECIEVDRVQPGGGMPPAESPRQGPDDLAYILFTSGSTGVPKGVMIAHRGVVNALVETAREFAIGPEDSVLGVTALHHDMSIFDVFGVLGWGGTLVLPRQDDARDPAHWADLMRRHRVTVWNSVPAMMEMLLEHADHQRGAIPETLRLAFLGGDWLPIRLPAQLWSHATGVELVSVGGPTETTLWNIWYRVNQVDPEWKSIPYGRPIANTSYYLLNEWLEHCPVWVVGEMYCAGVGVSQGYWREEEQTRARFLIHPRTGERLYRTGDLGRRWPDGTLEFVGRADFQVKVYGQRIELGEVESLLSQSPIVKSAVVVVDARARGRKRLVAYVVYRDGAERDPDAIREFLRVRLPEHMVPAELVALERLPLSPNGKVDRRALPAPPDAEPASSPTADAPTADATAATELEIAQIIASTLSLERVDSRVSVLSYGASSIDMVRIGNQLERRFGRRPRIDQLFRMQTAASLAKYYKQAAERQPPPVHADASTAVGRLLSSFEELSDPSAREAFRGTQPGIRRDLAARAAVRLERPHDAQDLKALYLRRHSHRMFSLKPVPFAALSGLLASLSQATIDGKAKYLYASPGGLYPTQTYVHVKAGRVDGVRGGAYYYDPIAHALVPTAIGVELDRAIHIPFINTPVFDEAAFSMFLIAQLKAIGPSYGPRSLHFVTIEAGIMAHLLEERAPDFELGLCQIGSVDFDRIRGYFVLDDGHFLVHSLVGGRVTESTTTETDDGDPASRAAQLLERISSLSPEEVKTLLEADAPSADEPTRT